MPHSLTRLKELGEKATPGRGVYSENSDYAEVVKDGAFQAMCASEADGKFLEAVSDPQTVAALIAVVEAAHNAMQAGALKECVETDELLLALQEFTP